MTEYVNHPQHYQSENGIEVIDVIEAFELNFHLGNAVKYILRAGKKDNQLQDLRKAMWYLSREIKRMEKADGKREMDSGCNKAQGCFEGNLRC
jgi:hypothetical protein